MMGEKTNTPKFNDVLKKALSTSHDELKRREAEYKKQRAEKKRPKS